MTTVESPSEKAWAYLRKVMNDDDKFFTLKVKSEPVDVIGSKGGRYILYPNGRVVIVGKTEAKLGKAINENRIAHPDILSTLWVWITQKESEFLKNWQCGNLSVLYEGRDEETAVDIDARLRVAQRRHRAIMNYRHHWYDDIWPSSRTMHKLVLVTAIVGLVCLFQQQGYIDLTLMVAPFTTLTAPNSTVTQPVEVTQPQEPQAPGLNLLIIFLGVFVGMLILKKILEEVI